MKELRHLIPLFLFCTVPGLSAKTLEPPSLGKITDAQGIVLLRPIASARKTPVEVGMPIQPRDVLGTGARGANAAQVRLNDGGEIILGPASSLQFRKEGLVLTGEAEFDPAEDKSLTLFDPKSGKVTELKKTTVYREQSPLEQQPNWLKGFKGAVTTESMGQLLCKVDGRDVPLTIGYHQVTVDIRDQIARTTIEETFVNHTDSRLEGVFYFPLPQDASISGFGMWINGELVEADVVEKQRAREIYETILRERRDPGLLEWTGGNLFKARVFPIFAHSEKRVKITYTQVLPYRNGKVSYSYALQSEMLRQTPLRELQVTVNLSSALPVTRAGSPSHPGGQLATPSANTAKYQFRAEEYTPSSDFEFTYEVEAPPVTFIPHQRGEDGYFLAMITPPADDGWTRQLTRDGDPIRLLLLCDTSGSMTREQRESQAILVATLLDSLGPGDSFKLATCDVTADWYDGNDTGGALEFLENRRSLGWTDLDLAFESVAEQIPPKSKENFQIVYVGDGISSTGNADPVATADRLTRKFRKSPATFHAVGLGSTFESGILKTIARLGAGGSFRTLSGSESLARVASDLLAEMTTPGLRDLEVSFDRLATARVYPAELPNLSAGSQQVIVGRYLPTGDSSRKGKINLRARRGSRQVKFSAPLILTEAESGNSFIPRLWARNYLDALLEQGVTREIKEEIIGLSEEYHIMTPYTSFLVLESDADRERFKVKRRFNMRDGERFFSEGRDQVDTELLGEQMRIAGTWRQNLRKQLLRDYSAMGRNISQTQAPLEKGFDRSDWRAGKKDAGPPAAIDVLASSEKLPHPTKVTADVAKEELREEEDLGDSLSTGSPDDPDLTPGELPAQTMPFADVEIEQAEGKSRDAERLQSRDKRLAPLVPGRQAEAASGMRQEAQTSKYRSLGGDSRSRSSAKNVGGGGMPLAHDPLRLDVLIPKLPTGSTLPTPPENPRETWGEEALELLKKIDRTSAYRALLLDGKTWRVTRQITNYNLRYDRPNSINQSIHRAASDRWATDLSGSSSFSTTQWADKNKRGAVHHDFGISVTGSVTGDRKIPEGPISAPHLDDLVANMTFQVADPPVVTVKGDQNTVVITIKTTSKMEILYTIDLERSVILKRESRRFADQKITGWTVYDDFVERIGKWWPTRIESFNAEGKRISTEVATYESLDEFGELVKEAAFSLQLPLPKFEHADKSHRANSATGEDHIVLLKHYTSLGRFDDSDEHLKSNLSDWISLLYFQAARQNDKARELVLKMAKGIAEDSANLATAAFLYNQAQQSLAYNERITLLELLEPVYLAAPDFMEGPRQWGEHVAIAQQNQGQNGKALEIRTRLAEEYPRRSQSWTNLSYSFQVLGRLEEARKALSDAIETRKQWWTEAEKNGFRQQFLNLLNQEKDTEAKLAYIKKHGIDANVDSSWPYLPYLELLIVTGEPEEAKKSAIAWMEEGLDAPTDQGGPVRYRLLAGINLALRNYGTHRYNYGNGRIEAEYLPLLVQIVEKFATEQTYITNRIFTHYRFQRTEQYKDLLREFSRSLLGESAELPLPIINYHVNWAFSASPELGLNTQEWTTFSEALRERWETTPAAQRSTLDHILYRILEHKVGQESLVAFLARRYEVALEGQDPVAIDQASLLYFNTLLKQPWTAPREELVFQLFLELYRDQTGESRSYQRLLGLHLVTDWLNRSHREAHWSRVEKKEELSRTEYRAQYRDAVRNAQLATLERLRNWHGQIEDEDFRDWIKLETVFFQGLTKTELPEALGEVLGYLDEDPNKLKGNRHLIFYRALDSALLLASRLPDHENTAELGTFLQRAIETHPKEKFWKAVAYDYLVLLDQPEKLLKNLEQWIDNVEHAARWQLAVGLLLAEIGEVDRSIRQFELAEKEDALGPSHYRLLAKLYLTRKDREDHDRALLASYLRSPENVLSQRFYNEVNRLQSRATGDGPPEPLSRDFVNLAIALLRKSAYPSNYLSHLGSVYRNQKDHQLLAPIAPGMIGHSSQQIYTYIRHCNSYALQHLREEASCDILFESIAKVRKQTESEVDHRALDLLEVEVARRAAQVQNQPGQHIPRALAAMKRSFKREWEPGEPVMMAAFLENLQRLGRGGHPHEPLESERDRQFSELHRKEKEGSFERLRIAHHWARTQYHYREGMQAKAIDRLRVALDEWTGISNGGRVSYQVTSQAGDYLNWMTNAKRYREAESYILEELDHPVEPSLRNWLVQQRFSLYISAIRHRDAIVSLGSGQDFFDAAEPIFIREIKAHKNPYHHLGQLIQFYRVAHDAKTASVADRLGKFARNGFSASVPALDQNLGNMVQTTGDLVHHVLGPVPALTFYLDQLDREPEANLGNYQSVWYRCGHQVAWHRHQIGDDKLGDLKPRLLGHAKKYLHRYLTGQSSYHRGDLFYRSNRYFWSSQADQWTGIANEVLEENKGIEQVVVAVARYFHDGLHAYERGIEILEEANERELLTRGNQLQLVYYLEARQHWDRSIVLLQSILGQDELALQLSERLRLMTNLNRVKKRDESLKVARNILERLEKGKVRTESNLAQVANYSVSCRFPELAIELFEEIIPLHQRTAPRRGIGNGTLSSYYQQLSSAHQMLGQTGEAVEAASGAIVSWGMNQSNRSGATHTLQSVLRNAPNLDGYAAKLQETVEETGLENPIVRKALGIIYLEKKEEAKAIHHLTIARENQPGDITTQLQLVEAYQRSKDIPGAIDAVHEALALSPRNLDLIGKLYQLHRETNQGEELERSATQLVEAMPHEAEGHAKFAELCERREKLEQSAFHWSRVAAIRSLEPTGLLKKLAVEVRLEDSRAAKSTARALTDKKWPERFGDVHGKARNLLSRL